MATLQNMSELSVDWSGCGLVERVPGKVGGVPILKNSRLQADAVVLDYAHGSPLDEIEENFGISQDILRGVLTYAAGQVKQIQLWRYSSTTTCRISCEGSCPVMRC